MNWLGIDVAKASLAVALRTDKRKLYEREFDNDAKGASHLLKWMRSRVSGLTEVIVVMEATGVYHEKVALVLHEAGCRVIVANPKRVRDYARRGPAP